MRSVSSSLFRIFSDALVFWLWNSTFFRVLNLVVISGVATMVTPPAVNISANHWIPLHVFSHVTFNLQILCQSSYVYTNSACPWCQELFRSGQSVLQEADFRANSHEAVEHPAEGLSYYLLPNEKRTKAIHFWNFCSATLFGLASFMGCKVGKPRR